MSKSTPKGTEGKTRRLQRLTREERVLVKLIANMQRLADEAYAKYAAVDGKAKALRRERTVLVDEWQRTCIAPNDTRWYLSSGSTK